MSVEQERPKTKEESAVRIVVLLNTLDRFDRPSQEKTPLVTRRQIRKQLREIQRLSILTQEARLLAVESCVLALRQRSVDSELVKAYAIEQIETELSRAIGLPLQPIPLTIARL